MARTRHHPLAIPLLAIHVGLLAWALVGLAEWTMGSVPWPAVSNPLFPRWLLLVHWLSVVAAALALLAGYARRWPGTPTALAAAYLLMAAVCAIETFGYLTHRMRFAAMAAEYAAYVLILLALWRAPALARRFT